MLGIVQTHNGRQFPPQFYTVNSKSEEVGRRGTEWGSRILRVRIPKPAAGP